MQKFIIFSLFFILTGFSAKNINDENQEFFKKLNNIKISAVAPASACNAQLLQDIQSIPKLKLITNNLCFQNNHTAFHSNSDEIRLQCLKDTIFDQSTEVIWALRGGYGSAKLIQGLNKLEKPSKEKFFIGYSDITALHLFLSQKWGWKTIHGAGIIELLDRKKNRANFIKIAEIISGKVKTSQISGLSPINPAAINTKKITGKLTGGNLTIVQSSIGTDWQIESKGKILFLEDLDVKPYQIDRMLNHLKQSNILDGVISIIFGSFNKNDANTMQALSDFASNLNIPAFKTNKFGHEEINEPIIYNTNSFISTSSKGTFILVMDAH
jgi:muramoyltetrapeptide carboxypeptidase